MLNCYRNGLRDRETVSARLDRFKRHSVDTWTLAITGCPDEAPEVGVERSTRGNVRGGECDHVITIRIVCTHREDEKVPHLNSLRAWNRQHRRLFPLHYPNGHRLRVCKLWEEMVCSCEVGGIVSRSLGDSWNPGEVAGRGVEACAQLSAVVARYRYRVGRRVKVRRAHCESK